MMDKIQGNDPVESKAITFTEVEGGTVFPTMMTAFEEENNDALDRAGFRGRYVIFTVMDSGIQDCFYDPRNAELAIMGESVKNMMAQVKRGWETHGREGVNWADLEHGEGYEPDDFQRMM